MRRRTKIILVLGALVLLALGWVVLKTSQEFSFEGRNLSEWLSEYDKATTVGHADDGFRRMGTNAIPGLLKWISSDSNVSNFSKIVKRFLRGLNWQLNEDPGLETIQAFKALGPMAEPAIPALAHCLHHPKNLDVALRAAQSLAYIGPKAHEVLIAEITNPNPDICWAAIVGIMRCSADTNYVAAVPGLVACLQHSEERIARFAAIVLGQIRLIPELSIPALTKATSDKREPVCRKAIEALGNFGMQASNALSALLPFTQSTNDSSLRIIATNAIRKIDPNALPK